MAKPTKGDLVVALLDRHGRTYAEELARRPDATPMPNGGSSATGMGDVGVDVFFREVQVIWDELRPFADRRALEAAKRLGLASDAKGIARPAAGDPARLVAALVRTRLAGDYDDVRDAARSR